MPLTRLSLYEIAGNDDIIVTHAGPHENGKYSGWITHGAGNRCRPIVNTDARYETPALAEAAMRELVHIAKEFTEGDLNDPANPIRKLFESPEGELIQEVVQLSKVKAP